MSETWQARDRHLRLFLRLENVSSITFLEVVKPFFGGLKIVIVKVVVVIALDIKLNFFLFHCRILMVLVDDCCVD